METLVIAEDQKRNGALRGLAIMIDAHEKNMMEEGVSTMMIEEVEGIKDAMEDLL